VATLKKPKTFLPIKQQFAISKTFLPIKPQFAILKAFIRLIAIYKFKTQITT
jgi:hypothetical protein